MKKSEIKETNNNETSEEIDAPKNLGIKTKKGKSVARKSEKQNCDKGHFFSDDSALTNRPNAKMQLSLIFLRIFFYFFWIFCLKITQ